MLPRNVFISWVALRNFTAGVFSWDLAAFILALGSPKFYFVSISYSSVSLCTCIMAPKQKQVVEALITFVRREKRWWMALNKLSSLSNARNRHAPWERSRSRTNRALTTLIRISGRATDAERTPQSRQSSCMNCTMRLRRRLNSPVGPSSPILGPTNCRTARRPSTLMFGS